MDRLPSSTPCMGLRLLLFLLIVTEIAGRVVFPGEEGCTMESGEAGRCVPLMECPPVLLTFKQRRPVHCGFEGTTQIVCCALDNSTPGDPSLPTVDISPPPGYDALGCGESANKVIHEFRFRAEEHIISQPAGHTEDTKPPPPPSAATSHRQTRMALPQKLVENIPPVTPEVVGGHISLRAAWPWVALIGQRDGANINWFCGGVLINEFWVLSALHCFHDFKPEVIRLGEHDYEDNFDQADHQDYSTVDLVFYPDYKFLEGYHDLALIKLASKVDLTKFILPVCLPWGRKSEDSIVGNKTTIVGWGNTLYGGSPSSVLMEADVQVFPSSRCDTSYSTLFTYNITWPRGIGPETLCAGDPDGGKDACQGDSGGPLVLAGADRRFVLAGIVSRGFGCGHKDFPGLYANIRYAPYLAWVKKVAFSSQ